MLWYKKFGFRKNPFRTDTLNDDFNILYRDEESEEVIYRIASASMLLIEGKKGTGKTTLLRHAIENFKGKGKVIYINARKLNKRLDISRLIHKKPKHMILLLDNIQYLSKDNNDKIKYYFDQDRIKSVVFTTTSYKDVSFSASIRDRIGKNIIRLQLFKQSDILNIVRKRLGDSDLFPEAVLTKIYFLTNNIKDFLKMCDSLGEYLAENNKEKVEEEDINNIDLPSDEDAVEPYICDKCAEDLIKIGNYWRCPHCDMYCENCGALVEEDDEFCPECGIDFAEEVEK